MDERSTWLLYLSLAMYVNAFNAVMYVNDYVHTCIQTAIQLLWGGRKHSNQVIACSKSYNRIARRNIDVCISGEVDHFLLLRTLG